MKRVLIFSTAYFPFVGGAEVAIKEISDRLLDYEFDLVTARMDRSLEKMEKKGNVNIYRLGIGNARFDKMFLALFGGWFGARLQKKKKYDCAWSMMASFGGFATLSFHNRTSIPYLLTLQEGDPIEYILKKVRFVRSWFNRIFTSASGLQAISSYLLQWGKDMGFSGNTLEVVPNGVDVSRFTEKFDNKTLDHIRQSFGFSQQSVIVVTASRLVEKNGVEHIIRALPLLPHSVCLVICGVGHLEKSLQLLAKELKLGNRIKWLGNISHAELPQILASSDIFIRPSLSEGLGNAFLEAMAVGLPTIGTRVGGIPDFLEEGKTGFFCEPRNPQSIAHIVQHVLTLSEQEKKQIHKNVLQLIQDKYNWEYISRRMNVLFERISKPDLTKQL